MERGKEFQALALTELNDTYVMKVLCLLLINLLASCCLWPEKVEEL